jgi:hypothetical protein
MVARNHTHKGDLRKTARKAYLGLKKKHHKATNHTHKGDVRRTARRAYMGLKKKHKATNHTHKGDFRKTARRAYMGLKTKYHKKKHRKSHRKSHKKYHRKPKKSNKKKIRLSARGLNKPGLTLTVLDVTKKNNDGEVASSPVQNLLPGLPLTPPDGKYGDGVLARQKWMNKQDNDAFLEVAQLLGLKRVQKPKNFRTPSLNKSQNNKYLNLIAELNSLKPSSTWRTVKTKRNKKK